MLQLLTNILRGVARLFAGNLIPGEPLTRDPVSTFFKTLSLTVLGRNVRVRCEDAEAWALLVANYAQMQGELKTADLSYTVRREKASSAFVIRRNGQEPLIASDDSEFLFLFEKDMTIELQELRPDLYFIHAAVVEFTGKALMLVGASGCGKSMTTWALLHHGFRYLSDELGPVDLKTFKVYPYPHALCLKAEPPGSYLLPEKTLYTSRTLYVPVEDLPSGVVKGPIPLAAIFFLCYRPEGSAPTVQPISKAAAGVHLLANALNPLAHPGDGLDGAIEIAARDACFELLTADLPRTCTLVKATLKWELPGGSIRSVG